MNDHEERLMSQYGITAETKAVFRYDGYRYERLVDAVNYARTQQAPSGMGDTPHDANDPHGRDTESVRAPDAPPSAELDLGCSRDS
jgi:hypothetical protein